MSASKNFVLVKVGGKKISVHGSRLGKPFTKESDAKRSISKRQTKGQQFEIMEILP